MHWMEDSVVQVSNREVEYVVYPWGTPALSNGNSSSHLALTRIDVP